MPDKKIVKVTKHYERKVNLSGISSQYDNISHGTYIAREIEYASEEDMRNGMLEMADIVRQETEEDIRNTFIMLKGMVDDVSNDALLGLGTNLQIGKKIEKEVKKRIEKGQDKKKENSPELEKEDLPELEETDEFDFEEFQGGFLDDDD